MHSSPGAFIVTVLLFWGAQLAVLVALVRAHRGRYREEKKRKVYGLAIIVAVIDALLFTISR